MIVHLGPQCALGAPQSTCAHASSRSIASGDNVSLTIDNVTTSISIAQSTPPLVPPSLPPSPPASSCGSGRPGSAIIALGLEHKDSYTPAEASRIFQYISQQEHQRHGTAYQGAGADPIALGHDADLNLDAAISPAELLIALLTQLVRKAHLDETTLAYVARL